MYLLPKAEVFPGIIAHVYEHVRALFKTGRCSCKRLSAVFFIEDDLQTQIVTDRSKKYSVLLCEFKYG